ncbi:MAG: molybdenum cofactor guanylyltransferase [Anaerolineales bacterium]
MEHGSNYSIRMLDLTVVIQAGGRSTRMGRDKGLVPFLGAPLMQTILDQVVGLGRETIIISNRPADYRRFGLPVYPDVFQDVGALGGLHAAIFHAREPYCLVLACDMPFINRPLLDHLLALAADFDAVIPRLQPPEGRRGKVFAEPFRAVYNKTCLAPIAQAIETGERRVISFFNAVNIRFVEREEIEHFDPDARSFFNVNTPDELAEAEQIARSLNIGYTDWTEKY